MCELSPVILSPLNSFSEAAGWLGAPPSKLPSEKESGGSGQGTGAEGGRQGGRARAEQSSPVAGAGLGRVRLHRSGKSEAGDDRAWRESAAQATLRSGGDPARRSGRWLWGGPGSTACGPQHADLPCGSRTVCAPGLGCTPCPAEAAREAPGWMLGFCTQTAFPDFRGRSGVCSREPVPVAPHPMATPQVLGRSGQAQSWRKAVGCRRPTKRASWGWRGRSQNSSRKVLAGPARRPPRCPARPLLGGCSLRPPRTVRSSSVTSAPARRPPLPRERPGPAQPRRPASPHSRDVRLYSPRDTAPCGRSADPPGGRGSLRGRRPPLRVTPSHVVAAEALQLAD